MSFHNGNTMFKVANYKKKQSKTKRNKNKTKNTYRHMKKMGVVPCREQLCFKQLFTKKNKQQQTYIQACAKNI